MRASCVLPGPARIKWPPTYPKPLVTRERLAEMTALLDRRLAARIDSGIAR